MYEHTHKHRILYADTDQMGYVYYGHYCKFYEIGRAESIRAIGITYKELEESHGIKMPVAAVESRFIKPAKYDELITIKSTLKEMPSKMIVYHHQIYNEQDELLHRGVVKLFFIDEKLGKRVSAPAYVTDPMKPYFE